MDLVKPMLYFATLLLLLTTVYIFEVTYRYMYTVMDVTQGLLRCKMFHYWLSVGCDEAVTTRSFVLLPVS